MTITPAVEQQLKLCTERPGTAGVCRPDGDDGLDRVALMLFACPVRFEGYTMELSQQVTADLERLQAALDEARSQGAESAAERAVELATALREIGAFEESQALCSAIDEDPSLPSSTRRAARYVSADIDVSCGRYKRASAILLSLQEELSSANSPALLLRVRRALCEMEPRADRAHTELTGILEQQRALQGLAAEDTLRTIVDRAVVMETLNRHGEAFDWLTQTID